MKVISAVAAMVALLGGTGLVAAQTVDRPPSGGAVDLVVNGPALAGASAVTDDAVGAAAAPLAPGAAAAGEAGTGAAGAALLLQSATYRFQPLPGASYPVAALSSSLLQQDRRRGVTWLLVGGALIGAGMLIGDDAGAAVSVGGAIVGAYGVFLMVRS